MSLTTSCLLAPRRMIGLVNYHRTMSRSSQLRIKATKGEPPKWSGGIPPKDSSSELLARIGQTLT